MGRSTLTAALVLGAGICLTDEQKEALMRRTRIGSPRKSLPARWEVLCRNARVLLPLSPAVRIADRLWRDEMRELRRWGFEESWDHAAVEEARGHVCEFCGNDMDLRVYVEHELGKHTYAFCTMRGCHWWLEF